MGYVTSEDSACPGGERAAEATDLLLCPHPQSCRPGMGLQPGTKLKYLCQTASSLTHRTELPCTARLGPHDAHLQQGNPESWPPPQPDMDVPWCKEKAEFGLIMLLLIIVPDGGQPPPNRTQAESLSMTVIVLP